MNTKTTPKDFFLHLGATIALYSSAIALMDLAFATINAALPDALSYGSSAHSIVWPISMLVVLVPILYIIEWAIARDFHKMPGKREIWVRRWRIYLTLFLTAGAIAGDLIAIINTYLNGEITSRFILKVLVVLVVCMIIFAYYIIDRSLDSRHSKIKVVWLQVLAWLGIIFVLSGIVSGFVIVGSPAHQRALQFDEERVTDLSNLQWQIVNYWQSKGTLPQNLSVLNDPISGVAVPNDPETGKAYEYAISNNPLIHGALAGEAAFQLCATFDAASSVIDDSSYGSPASLGDSTNDSWQHAAGHTCFNRSIDPSLYPPHPGTPASAN